MAIFQEKLPGVLCFHNHRCPPGTLNRMERMKRMSRKRCQQLQHRPPLSSRRGQGLRQFQNKLPQIIRLREITKMDSKNIETCVGLSLFCFCRYFEVTQTELV